MILQKRIEWRIRMKKLFVKLTATILIMIYCFATNAYAEEKQKPVFKNDNDVQQYYKNFMGLTSEERMEDYEYLWKTLRQSYPFFGVCERSGIDVESIYQKYKKEITDTDSDYAFFSYIIGSMQMLNQTGHIVALDSYSYDILKKVYQNAERRREWFSAFNGEKTIKTYQQIGEIFEAYEKLDGKSPSFSAGKIPSIRTELLEPGKTAYVAIDSFSESRREQDYKILTDFYRSVGDYENLIIDISKNSGGSDMYWSKNIVAPNITEVIGCDKYALFQMSRNNQPFLDEALRKPSIKPISALPQLEKMNQKDLSQMTHFTEFRMAVSPESKDKLFKGKIWLLVSEDVYSAAEAFTVFCKSTGFATIVGTQTGGDGIGIDPAYLVLPNSGIMVRYSIFYGINDDGTNNEEYGTIPDILSTPLQTCLSVIDSKQ